MGPKSGIMGSDTTRESKPLRFIASTLPGWPDVSVLRAAARAGATAILNLEAVAAADVRSSLAALTRHKPGRIGVRLDRLVVLEPLADLFSLVDTFVVASGSLDETIDLIDRLRGPSREILLECTTLEEARVGVELGVDGLIAKGHESGGRVADETTFVLAQRLLSESTLPVYAQGGIGRHTIGACFVAGCAGVVLDAQLTLARESTLPGGVKTVLERMGGDETVCLGAELDEGYRVYRRPGFQAVEDLQKLERELARSTEPDPDNQRQVASRHPEPDQLERRGCAALAAGSGRRLCQDPGGALPIGQRHPGWAVERTHRARHDGETAQAPRPRRAAGSGASDGLSDPAGTDDARQRHGGFRARRGGRRRRCRSWRWRCCAGRRCGRCSPKPRRCSANDRGASASSGSCRTSCAKSSCRAIEEFVPPFALIAGGRPDQAAKLEKHGIPTYLHVPAPSLLQMFLDDGARRFIFEGRECGGHVGPRTSFVLWESMVDTLLEAIDRGRAGERAARRVRRRNSRRALGGDGRHDRRAARKSRRPHRRADGHGLSLHRGSGRDRRDRRRLPGRSGEVLATRCCSSPDRAMRLAAPTRRSTIPSARPGAGSSTKAQNPTRCG